MPNFIRYAVRVALVLATFGLGGAAHAADLGPEAFYGHFVGSGIMQTPGSGYFGFTNRDLDVQIGPQEAGFFVEWTTVMRDVSDKRVQRKNMRLTFEPSGRPGIYVEHAAEADRSSGLSWANIDGSTLTVWVVVVFANGTYEVQTYQRTLTKSGMTLYFRSDRDGQTIRFVTANLTKQAQ